MTPAAANAAAPIAGLLGRLPDLGLGQLDLRADERGHVGHRALARACRPRARAVPLGEPPASVVDTLWATGGSSLISADRRRGPRVIVPHDRCARWAGSPARGRTQLMSHRHGHSSTCGTAFWPPAAGPRGTAGRRSPVGTCRWASTAGASPADAAPRPSVRASASQAGQSCLLPRPRPVAERVAGARQLVVRRGARRQGPAVVPLGPVAVEGVPRPVAAVASDPCHHQTSPCRVSRWAGKYRPPRSRTASAVPARHLGPRVVDQGQRFGPAHGSRPGQHLAGMSRRPSRACAGTARAQPQRAGELALGEISGPADPPHEAAEQPSVLADLPVHDGEGPVLEPGRRGRPAVTLWTSQARRRARARCWTCPR